MSLLSLLHLAALQVDEGTRQTWRLLDAPAAWVTVLVVLPLAALVSWIGYHRSERVPNGWKAVLAGLRFAAILVLLAVLARPVLVERREEVHPAQVLVLVDDSASMQRKDAYRGDEDARSAVRELAGTPAEETTRVALAAGALERSLLPHLAERDYAVTTYAFADTLAPTPDLAALGGQGSATHLGDALLQVLAAHRGRNVTDVVVLSDGRNTGGSPTLDAAAAASAAGIPVHTCVLGDARPERNALVELVEAPTSALEGDDIAVAVRVLGRGTLAGDSAPVVLEELGPDGTVLVSETETELTETGERVVLVAESRGARSGDERRFRVSVPPFAGETVTEDNSVELIVRVSPEKVRVLYVDGYPRWEYRFLKNLLLRADENIEVQCFLLSATQDFPQEASAELEPLSRVPTARRDLLENYDVVILGDVNPYEISPDPAKGEEFVLSLRDFVESGGGLLFQAGEYENPRSFPPGSPLEELLPVTLDTTGALRFEGDTSREYRPLLEDPSQPHEITRLHPDPETNRRLWETEDGLRGFYWYAPVVAAKPASQVLLRHPTDQSPRGERYPLLVTGYYPAGRTLFLGFDSTYRWRYHYGDRYHERFWRNSIRWLALGRLKSGDRRYRLETPRTRYALDERVPLVARVLDEDFRPSQRPSVDVRYAPIDGRPEDVTLPLDGATEGLYRGSLQLERPGPYRAWIEKDGQTLTSAEFEVVLPSRESADPSPDPGALKSLAALTGGRFTTVTSLPEVLREFPGDEERREPVSSKLEDAWDHWGTLLLALGLLSAEWIGRKRWELV